MEESTIRCSPNPPLSEYYACSCQQLKLPTLYDESAEMTLLGLNDKNSARVPQALRSSEAADRKTRLDKEITSWEMNNTCAEGAPHSYTRFVDTRWV